MFVNDLHNRLVKETKPSVCVLISVKCNLPPNLSNSNYSDTKIASNVNVCFANLSTETIIPYISECNISDNLDTDNFYSSN